MYVGKQAGSLTGLRSKVQEEGGNFFRLALVRGKKSDLIDVSADVKL